MSYCSFSASLYYCTTSFAYSICASSYYCITYLVHFKYLCTVPSALNLHVSPAPCEHNQPIFLYIVIFPVEVNIFIDKIQLFLTFLRLWFVWFQNVSSLFSPKASAEPVVALFSSYGAHRHFALVFRSPSVLCSRFPEPVGALFSFPEPVGVLFSFPEPLGPLFSFPEPVGTLFSFYTVPKPFALVPRSP